MLPSTPNRRSQTDQDGYRGSFLASMGMIHGTELASRSALAASLLSSPSSSSIVQSPIPTPYLPPDLLQIQSLLSSGQLPNVRIVSMEVASSHLHHIRRLQLSNNSTLNLAVAPPPNVHLLRHERYAMETEALVLSLLRPIGLPVATVVRHDSTDKLLGAPFLLTTALPGAPLSRVLLSTNAPQGPHRAALEASLQRLVNAVSSHAALMFGPAPLVATGKGYDNWQEAFRAMLADAIKDAEDAFVHLPYGQIWQAFEKARGAFDEVQQPRLVVPGLGKASNVLVDMLPNGAARICGLQGFQGAFWGDSEMGPILDGAPEGQLSEVDTGLFIRDGRRRKILLYKIYKQIIAVATSAYRPRTTDHRELHARRELTSCLAKLDALDQN